MYFASCCRTNDYMGACQADDYLEKAAQLYLAGELDAALRHAKAALAAMGTTISAMQGGSQVQAQRQQSHQQVLAFIDTVEAEIVARDSSRIRVQSVQYQRARAPEC